MCLQYVDFLQAEVVDRHLHARWNRTPIASQPSEASSKTSASSEQKLIEQERQQALRSQDQDCSIDEVMRKDMDKEDFNAIPLKIAEALVDILTYITWCHLENSNWEDFAGKMNREEKELKAFCGELVRKLNRRIDRLQDEGEP